MKTVHRAYFKDARDMPEMDSASVDLVVTSPPYPMIEMWDDVFAAHAPAVGRALKKNDGRAAFGLMHESLDPVWKESLRVLKPGGLACINIGDAARTVGGSFMLYPNHARILTGLLGLGFTPLPAILWRKQTNAPNKFMGSGMYPAGAYVTLEHEYILIVRKGAKREFATADEKRRRRQSAIFWEERNAWYSDVWLELKGTRQNLRREAGRSRSGAFPFELAYRLISMFSVKGDTVLDPFLGTGTTLRAAAAAGRNCVGYEIEAGFRRDIFGDAGGMLALANQRIRGRIDEHLAFVGRCRETGRELKHRNRHYGFAVVTGQETELLLEVPEDISAEEPDGFQVSYAEDPRRVFDRECSLPAPPCPNADGQLPLF